MEGKSYFECVETFAQFSSIYVFLVFLPLVSLFCSPQAHWYEGCERKPRCYDVGVSKYDDEQVSQPRVLDAVSAGI